MKRKSMWIVAVAVPIVIAVAFVAASGGNPGRQMRALFAGADAVAYAEPRRAFALTAGPPQPRVPPGEAGIDASGLAAAVEYAAVRNTRALIVGRGGHIVFEKYWGDATADSTVDASEFTPVLAALLTGVALNERALTSLDAPVSGYVAQWKEDPRGAITLRQLLAGDSGLAAPKGRPWPGTLAARYHVAENLGATLRAWPVDPQQQPGEAPMDVDADVLSIALSGAFAQPYRTALVERLWQPIGAGGFSLGIDGETSSMSHLRAGCCLRARIGDWMRIGELLANDGVFEGSQLTAPRFVRLMLTPTRKDSPRGFFTRVGGTFAARDVAWLEARGKQRLWVVPSLKLAILRVGGEPPTDQGWDEAMIPDSIIRGTSGWAPASVGEGIDPNKFAPH